ncbi:MAG: hypothetical protein ACLGH8_02185 [Bacteroidia bacterium]
MQLEPSAVDLKLEAFHRSWNIERLKNITIDEYADLTNHDSLCYWLEYGSDQLGAIGNVALHKFEIWRPNEQKEFKDDRYKFENGFYYNKTKGSNLHEAFNTVKNLIYQVALNSKEQNWIEIDKINYHSIAKWKLAFLFSNKRLLPIYSKRALIAIARGLGGEEFPYKTRVSELQKFILSYKPTHLETDFFAYENYAKYAEKKKTAFYIIGSKYGDDNGQDTIPKIDDFIVNKCVAVGFLDWIDFSAHIGAGTQKVNHFIAENWHHKKPALHKMQAIFRKLAQIKEGDIIAIKSHGSHNGLTLIAYAQVVSRNGSVYEHRKDILGHHIHVEFLDTGFYKSVGLTYAETIHELTKAKDGDRFDKVFGWYNGVIDSDDEYELEDYQEEVEHNGGFEAGVSYNEKSEATLVRSAIASSLVNRIHNKIQNRFIAYLKSTYPNDIVRGEKHRIDALLETETQITIFEIKPNEKAFSCIREGIGQLLDYSHTYKTNKQINIVIVGPNEPHNHDKAFINTVRSNLKIPFSYMAFDHNLLIATKF